MIFKLKSAYFKGFAQLEIAKYGNGRPAWRISDADTGENLLVATVNLPDCKDERLDDGSHVLIKDWSENEGVLASLVAAKVIGEPVGFVPSGYVQAMLCPVLTNNKEE